MRSLGEPRTGTRPALAPHSSPLAPHPAAAAAAAAPCAQQHPPSRPRHRAPPIGRRRRPAHRSPIGRRPTAAQGQAGGGRGRGGGSRAAIGWRGGVRIVRPRCPANGAGARPSDAHDAMRRGPRAPPSAPAPAGPARARQSSGSGSGSGAGLGPAARRLPLKALARRSGGAAGGWTRCHPCRCPRPLPSPALRKRWERTGGGVVMAAAAPTAAFRG